MKTFFIIVAVVGVLLPVVAPFDGRRSRRVGRRLFWGGFFLASASAFFVAYPPDWKSGIMMSLLACFLMLVTAYFTSPYLKIHGKIFAFHVQDSQADPAPDDAPSPSNDNRQHDSAPDSYGGLATATKTWWIIIPAVIICVSTVDPEKPLSTALSVGVIVVIALVFGYGDASWGYSVARGQRLQFVIVSVITLGAFAVFYIGAYCAGKRWPLRRKQSMEYRAHPRHWKTGP